MLMVFNKIKITSLSFFAYIKYIVFCVKCNIACATSDKKSFIIQTLFMFANNFIWLAFWMILFFNSESNSINGIVFNDILYLWSVPTLAFGICFFLFGGVEDLSRMIANKEIDTILTKPKHSLISLITSSSRLSAMGDILYGLIMGILAVDFNPAKYLLLIFISIIGAFGFLGISILVNSLAFWFGDITKTARIYSMNLLLTLTIYPDSMFTGIIKILMYTALPAMYIAHIPINIVKNFNLYTFCLEIAIVFLILIIAIIVYQKGLKKYGN